MNDYAFKLYSKRIQDNGRILEEMAKHAVAQAKSPDDLIEKVASAVKQANLQGEHVNRVCEMANVEMFRRMYELEGDKTFAFPLVTSEKVAAINAPKERKTTISKAAAIQEMATYIPGSELMEKTAACGSSHKMKVPKYTEKDIIKYKTLAKRKKAKKEGAEKTSAISKESAMHELVWIDNGLRDTLELANNALERISLEKAAQLAEIGRIGDAYLRDGATLYDVVDLMGLKEITKEATVSIIASAGDRRWVKGEATSGIADPYGLTDELSKYAGLCIDEEDITKLAVAIIDTRMKIAHTLVDMEKTAESKPGLLLRGIRGLGDLLFGSPTPGKAALSELGYLASRRSPKAPLIGSVRKRFSEVPKEEYKRIKKRYGSRWVQKMKPKPDSKSLAGQEAKYYRVRPSFGGIVGNIERHPLPWLAGAVLAPSGYEELKSKLAQQKLQATAGLGNYQPTSYGSY